MEGPISSARTLPLPSPGALIGLIVVVAGLAGAGYLGYQRINPPASPVARNTAPVTRGDVLNSITATGTVSSTATSRVTFKTGGLVDQVYVSVGDHVEPGQILAMLDTFDLALALRQAEATLQANQSKLNVILAGSKREDIDAAQAQLDAAQAKLGAMQAGSRDEDLVAAQFGVASAQAKLSQVMAGPTQSDVDSARANVEKAQAALDSAKANLTKVMSGAAQADIQTAQIALNNTNSDLAAKQATLNNLLFLPPCSIGGSGGSTSQCQTISAVISAQQAVNAALAARDTAQIKLQSLQAGPLQTDVQTAQATVTQAQQSLRQAQDQLNTVLAGSTEADLAAARTTVSQAQNTLAQKVVPYIDADFAAQQQAIKAAQSNLVAKQQPYTAADIDSARAQVTLAQINQTQAQNNLDAATLVAPIAGVVSALNINAGEQTAGGQGASGGSSSSSSVTGNGLTITDPSQVQIGVQVDESDISQVAPGEVAQATFDALPGRTFEGRVTAISPTGTLTQGVVGYQVFISLNNSRGVLPGMTATAQIIRDQRQNVLVVPNRAITRGQGRDSRDRFVDVLLSDGTTDHRKVEVGLANDQVTELTSGVEEGEQVVIPQTTARAAVPGAQGGVFGGGGGGGPNAVFARPGGR